MSRFKISQNISIGFKIITLSAILAAVFLGLSYGFALINFREELSETTQIILEDEVILGVNSIKNFLDESKVTVQALAETPPFQGIIRSQKTDDYDELETSTTDQWRKRMASIFVAEMKARSTYDQLRFIDENGNEIVRVNKTQGGPFIVPADELQYKGDREYFQLAMKQQKGTVYTSRVNLNREGINNEIEFPYKPVLRIAVPIFDETNNTRKGVLVANLLFDEIIDPEEIVPRIPADVFIINTKGYYFVNPDESKKWGDPNDLNTGHNFFQENPNIIPSNLGGDNGTFTSDGRLYSFAKITPDENDLSRTWTVIGGIDESIIFSNVNRITFLAVLIGLGTYIILFFVFTFVINRLLAPMRKLTVLAENIGKGDFNGKIDIHSNDEIGKLARTFRNTRAQLQELYQNLEKKVQERTHQLEQQKTLLESSEAKLKEKLDETARLNKQMVNRELKMIELKKELEKCKKSS